jgi:hypothetical protein
MVLLITSIKRQASATIDVYNKPIKEKVMNQSDTQLIDKKIETQLHNNLVALRKSIKILSMEAIRKEINNKLDACTRSELEKLLKQLIKWEEDSLDPDLIDERVFDED